MSAISKGVDEEAERGPGQYVAVYQAMHDLHDKLLALDYSKQFVSEYKCPPINGCYFIRQANQSQQFFSFCCLSSYLLNKTNNRNDFKVDSFDDPNLTIDRILSAAQAHIDISPFVNTRHKFKQGFGLEVIGLLERLVDNVCLKDGTSLADQSETVNVKFVGLDGGSVDEAEEEDEIDNEDNEIELEEEFADYIIEDEGNLEEDAWDDEGVEGPEKAMIAAHTDLTEWKLELERILPQLNARLLGQSMYKSGAYENEWRLHYKAAMAQNGNIDSVFGNTAAIVGTLSGDIKVALDKIEAKENYLRQNSSTILAEWATVRERAERLRSAFQTINQETTEKADKLAELSEEDRTTKQAIEEYSLRMTDSSPLVEAKKARVMLKTELVRVNLQIGVAIQTLVRHVSLHTSSVY